MNAAESKKKAEDLVNAWMKSGREDTPDKDTLDAAHLLYKSQPLHECYWNNRFAIAVMCGLPQPLQRLAAFAVLLNSTTHHFEWITHSDYRMSDALKRIKINLDDIPEFVSESQGYSYLQESVASQIRRYYGLVGLTCDEREKLVEEMGRYRQ